MSDYSIVTFQGIGHEFHVPSTLADFYIGNQEFTIRWYGVLIAIGFLLALLFTTRLCRKAGIDVDKFYDCVIWGTIFGVLGARAYYVAFRWDYYSAHLGEIIRIQDGGLAIYGGILAAVLTCLVVCAIRKIRVLDVLDLAAVGFLMGQGIGRWGNFTNQEAFGVNTDLPWGMTSDKVKEYIITHQWFFEEHGLTVSPARYVHPTFLYESLWCLLGFVILYIMFSKHRKYRGQIMLSYMVWYGVERALVEGLRTDSLYLGATNIRISQWLSAGIAVLALILLIIQTIRYRNRPVLSVQPADDTTGDPVAKGASGHGNEEQKSEEDEGAGRGASVPDGGAGQDRPRDKDAR